MKRYEELRKLQPIYSNDVPVFLLDGQLLKDRYSDGCLLRLKLQNVGNKIIKSISLRVKTYDAKGNLLDIGEYNYLDLNSKRDGIIGTDKVFELKNNQTRDVDFKIQTIVFEDDSVLDVCDAKWEPLPEKEVITDLIKDPKMLEIYRSRNGFRTNYIAREFGDYWYCTCGGINHSHELKCHECLEELPKLKQSYNSNAYVNKLFKVGNLTDLKESYNMDTLTKRLDQRLDREERKEQKKKRQRIRLIKWVSSLAVAFLCVYLLKTFLVDPYRQYRDALSDITAGNYQKAYNELKELDSFFDSEKYLENFHFLPTHIDDNTNALSMDMTYDRQGRLIAEVSSFVVDDQPVEYKTTYSYKDDKLVSSVTETETKIFNSTYSDDGKTVVCESYLKEDIKDGEVDDEKKENYTYILEFDKQYNVTSVQLEGDYEETHLYTYEYNEDHQANEISSEDSYDVYSYSYLDKELRKIREESDDYSISYDNKLFYSTKIEPYVGWWYRNPWYLFVENRV